MDVCEPFRGKRITLLGLGLLGRGVGDAEFFASCGAHLTVSDKKSAHELARSVERLKDFSDITFHLGSQPLTDFTDTDLVVKAAGIPLDSPHVQAARDANVPVAMSTALFAHGARALGATLVGVTGTRGKSTITHMIHHALVSAGKRAHLGGNIRGISTLALLPQVRAGDIVVLELDSWQLQGFGDLKMSPDIAVFSNLMPDHQNYYRDMEEYFNDKANIFRFQKAGDTLVIGREIEKRVRAARPPVEPLIPETLAPDWTLRIEGEHNRHNAALAASALLALGLTSADIRLGLESFEGVEGRLQFVREIDGVKIYNDNNATTPEATLAAIKALDDGSGALSLILGGSEKGLELKYLVELIRTSRANVVVLTHPEYKGSERLANELRSAGVPFEEATDLEDAIEKGRKGIKGETRQSLVARPEADEPTRSEAKSQSRFMHDKGILLFSPAFASFGMFKNEYERNDEFLRLVGSL